MSAQRSHGRYVLKSNKESRDVIRGLHLETEGTNEVGKTKIADDVGDIANEAEDSGKESTDEATQRTKSEDGGEEFSDEFAARKC